LRWLAAGERRPAQAAGPKGWRTKARRAGTSSLGAARTRPSASIASASTPARPASRPEAPEPRHGPRPALDAAVVLPDHAAVPAPAPVAGGAPQLSLPLHLAWRAGVAREAVGHDLARVADVGPAGGLAEEALGGLLVPPGAEQESIAWPVPSTARQR
jgi:hypothetical protein